MCSTRATSPIPSASGTSCAPAARSPTPTGGAAIGCPPAMTTSRPSPMTSSTSARSRWRSSPCGDEPDDGRAARVRAAPDLGRSTPAHVDAAPPAALVLPPARRQLRAADPRSLSGAARRLRRPRAGRRRRRTTPSRSPSGSSPTSWASPTDMSDTFTGWVRDILEFGDDLERRDHRLARACSTTSSAELEAPPRQPGRRPAQRAPPDRGRRGARSRTASFSAWPHSS